MNHKDFNAVGNYYVDLYDLKVGEYFMQDTYSDVFLVTEIKEEDVEGTPEDTNIQLCIYTQNITNDVPCRWFYDRKIG